MLLDVSIPRDGRGLALALALVACRPAATREDHRRVHAQAAPALAVITECAQIPEDHRAYCPMAELGLIEGTREIRGGIEVRWDAEPMGGTDDLAFHLACQFAWGRVHPRLDSPCPLHLGAIEMAIADNHGDATVTLSSDQAPVRSALSQWLDRLPVSIRNRDR